ncbi:hypothetical protein RclHR1_05850006 [Rhizophagus clarus]|uniref:F-box domain-containing protein n=1 Tax=Rhizophagus clarus TaxID=94130 RepID=A0A2Z6SGK8_9GLOM|nr:hypothetical protein RclHR1_05850006 [Rhizophagus clarus]GES74691.1 hypothetical protein GLOIN_2v1777676 [Rhizophagus clarus]
MTNLNGDVLHLIIEELRNDKKTLSSCLSVNRVCCEITVPILWNDPWKFLKLQKKNKKSLLKIIISHLSDESINNLSQQNLSINSYQKPLFNYISYCKHLNFNIIQKVIDTFKEKSKIPIIKNEILKLFINENMKFTHLYIPKRFDYKMDFIGTEHCFSEIKFISCSIDINDHVLFRLIEICKSIKELELYFGGCNYNNNGIGRLIEAQENLFYISLIDYSYHTSSFNEMIENSLTKHSNTIYYFKITKPPTKILSSFVNLKVLELNDKSKMDFFWNFSLPHLEILRVKYFSEKALASLIKSTSGSLIEIKIDYCKYYKCAAIIQAIHRNCPNLKYLKLIISNWDILELEKVLINCQHLKVLFIITEYLYNWKLFFETLTKSSPANLFKFKFQFVDSPSSKLLRFFFDNWKGVSPILLSFDKKSAVRMDDLIRKYEAEGIIKNHNNLHRDNRDDGFEWD